MADQSQPTPLPHAEGTQLLYKIGALEAEVSASREDIQVIGKSVKSLEQRLIGNGQPGLATRVDRLEIQAKQDRARRNETRQGGGRIITGVIVAVVVMILSEFWHRAVRDPGPAREGSSPAVVHQPNPTSPPQ